MMSQLDSLLSSVRTVIDRAPAVPGLSTEDAVSLQRSWATLGEVEVPVALAELRETDLSASDVHITPQFFDELRRLVSGVDKILASYATQPQKEPTSTVVQLHQEQAALVRSHVSEVKSLICLEQERNQRREDTGQTS